MLRFIMNDSQWRKLVSFCAILILLSGCATTDHYYYRSPIIEDVRKQKRHVIIVPAKFEPQVDYHPNIEGGPGQHMLKGAGSALGGVGSFSATGAAAILVFPLLGVIALSGAAAGYYIYERDSVPEEWAKQIEEAAANALVELDVQGTMAEHVYIAGNNLTNYEYTIMKEIGPGSQEEIPNYRTLNLEGNYIILEISATSLGFEGGKGSDPLISFYLSVNARAVDVHGGEEMYSDIWRYVSKKRPLSEWVENNAQLLNDEYEHGYQTLAENIIENIFLVYESEVVEFRNCVLKPIYPAYVKWRGAIWLKNPEVGSRQPTLEWEPFPREKDVKADKEGILNRIDEITYDLKIWSEQDFIQNKPLYTRQGIGRPEHKIEITLEPSKQYLWTFRARFKLDDQYRFTKWAREGIPYASGESPCNLNSIPIKSYWRFETPSE